MRRFWTFLTAATLATLTISTGPALADGVPPVPLCVAGLTSWSTDQGMSANKARVACDRLIVTQTQADAVKAFQVDHAPTLKVWNWLGDGHTISSAALLRATLCEQVLTDALDLKVGANTARTHCDRLVVGPDSSREVFAWQQARPETFDIWQFNPKH